MKKEKYDLIVIGAGHAGCEAAYQAALNKRDVLLLTINLDSIAFLINSFVVFDENDMKYLRELKKDHALTAKVLEETKFFDGELFHSREVRPIILVDTREYFLKIKSEIERVSYINLRQDMVVDIVKKDKNWLVLSKFGHEYLSTNLIICCGSFLSGQYKMGKDVGFAGRYGEIQAPEIRDFFIRSKIKLKKTSLSTLPIIEQRDLPEERFLPLENKIKNGMTMFFFKSIYKNKKMLILIGPQGRSNSYLTLKELDSKIETREKLKFLTRLNGFFKFKIVRPGYILNHEYIEPSQIIPTLEIKNHQSLFVAGEISGPKSFLQCAYEGFVAGSNVSCETIRSEG